MSETAQRRPALVTGASGGIGEAFVHLLAARGFDVVLVARREDQLFRVKGVAQVRHPERQFHVLPLDLARAEASGELTGFLQARQLWPGLLINNAGFGRVGRADELGSDEQLEMIDLNCRALTALSLACLPKMRADGRGGIIHLASVAAFLPGPYMAVYYATKAYVLAFSEALAAENAAAGVKISALCPGPVATGFQDRAGLHGALIKRMSQSPAAVAAEGYAGWQAGQRVVVPGLPNQLGVALARILPRGISARVAERLQRPG